MKAGIVIEAWKLPIFEAHLKAGGFHHEISAGLGDNTLFLTVLADDVKPLARVIAAATLEASRTGAHNVRN